MVAIVGLEEVVPLRAAVLRPGLPLEAAFFAGDEALSTWHFAALSSQGEVLGVASYFAELYPGLRAEKPYRLRGMATAPAYQRRWGIGRQLLRESLSFLARRGVDLVWCYARIGAVPFYDKMGFRWVEEAGVVEIPGVGPHRVGYYPLAKGVAVRGV